MCLHERVQVLLATAHGDHEDAALDELLGEGEADSYKNIDLLATVPLNLHLLSWLSSEGFEPEVAPRTSIFLYGKGMLIDSNES